MPTEVDASPDELDQLYEALARELESLVGMGEAVVIELDHIDDIRTATARNGDQLVAARRSRRSAIRARTQAAESCRQAGDARQRSVHLGRQLDATALRARALMDASTSLPRPTAPPRHQITASE